MMTNAASMVFPQRMSIVEPQVDWSTKIAEVMREQFGLRPKQQSVMYKTPYHPACDLTDALKFLQCIFLLDVRQESIESCIG